MKNYVKREWLNGDESASTGSVVAFYGRTSYGSEIIDDVAVLEIADCHCKVRLHKIQVDTMSDFICKLRKLEKVVSEFADFLESEVSNDSDS